MSSGVTGITSIFLNKVSSVFTAVGIFAFLVSTEESVPDTHGLNALEQAEYLEYTPPTYRYICWYFRAACPCVSSISLSLSSSSVVLAFIQEYTK